jgi:hypothetical protein
MPLSTLKSVVLLAGRKGIRRIVTVWDVAATPLTPILLSDVWVKRPIVVAARLVKVTRPLLSVVPFWAMPG